MHRIVHLGFGNFHRAHQAWYTQAAGDGWAITGVAMTRPDLRDALLPWDYAYTLAVQHAHGLRLHKMAVHDKILVLPEDPDAVIAAIAAPETQIVTLTITEKGYGLGPAGVLDLTDPVLAGDIRNATARSAIAVLSRGIAARADSTRPLTVIACDNLASNGPALHAAVLQFASASGLDIAPYVAEKVRFPATMVDRITPATTASLRTRLAEPAPVLTEAFSEWVIEDRFATPRPDWDRVGVRIVPDITTYEMRKLHVLNAAHSLLAYRGLLRGHVYVHEAIADPVLSAAVAVLWDEARACLPDAAQADLAPYCDQVRARFAVRQMRHRLDQIARDGAEKLSARVVPILTARLANDEDAPAAMACIAGWLAWSFKSQDGSPTDADHHGAECLNAFGAQSWTADDRDQIIFKFRTLLSDPHALV